MKNDPHGNKAGEERRVRTRGIRLRLPALSHVLLPPLLPVLLPMLLAALSLAAQAQDRLLLEGIFDAEAYKTNDGSYSLTRNDGDLSGLGRLQLWSALQLSSHLQWYASGEIQSDNASGSWETDAELEQFALRYSSGSDGYYIIEAGKVLPPIAMFSERNLSTQNPLISQPDFLYPDYPLGVRLTGSAGWLDYRAAVLDKPVINPNYLPAKPDSAWRPDLGIGITPLQGLRFGLGWTRGPYLDKSVDAFLPGARDWKDFDQRIWAFEFQYSRGYAELNSELVLARYDLPPQHATLDVVDYFVEFKYTFTPRVYGALRIEQNQYPFIREAPNTGLRTQDVTIRRLEAGVAYRFSADTQLKLAFQADNWSVEGAPGAYYPSGRSLAMQLSHHFDVRSWFAHGRDWD